MILLLLLLRGKEVLPDIKNLTAFLRDGSIRTLCPPRNGSYNELYLQVFVEVFEIGGLHYFNCNYDASTPFVLLAHQAIPGVLWIVYRRYRGQAEQKHSESRRNSRRQLAALRGRPQWNSRIQCCQMVSANACLVTFLNETSTPSVS